MRKSKILMCITLLGLCVCCGCGKSAGGDLSWIPSEYPTDFQQESESEILGELAGMEESETPETEQMPDYVENYELKLYDFEELLQAIVEEELETFADMAWDNQRKNGLYEPRLNEENGKNILRFFVSSTEGDDANDGLSPDRPKKSIDMFSGVSNVHIYLKTDDVFAVDTTFYVGDNTLIAAYGSGKRPVLDFYQEFNGIWTSVAGYPGVWQMDLSTDTRIYQGTNSIGDCNIGQLLINGEHNWKRVVGVEGDVFNYASYLQEAADGSWGIDWEKGLIYLYNEENPNQLKIKYAYPGFAMSLNHVQNVWLAGLEITGTGMHGISLSEVKDVNITNCYLHHIGGAVLKQSGIRYGNAIELWDSGENMTVQYNVADWIYDTCYTNQGSGKNTVQENIAFINNVGAHCFQGLEIWGDSYSQYDFEAIRYCDNVLLSACDVTAPNNSYIVNEKGKLLEELQAVTYRNGNYPYHQMSLLNTGTNRNYESLQFYGNVFAGTNRFLTLFLKGTVENGYPDLQDNIFVEINAEETDSIEADSEETECLYRYSDKHGTIFYCEDLPEELKGEQSVHTLTGDNYMEGMRSQLQGALNKFVNETE